MSDIGIEVCQLWKKFRRGERHNSLRDLVPVLAKRLVGVHPARHELGEGDFWALKDVSFEVRAGEALGVIGPNGAGKSTLLKLLSKILRPTGGYSRVRGRVGALIEVGAGFHPDLTGLENIHLQGAIMGMKRAQIVRRLDEIVEFAGVGDFLDTPLKRYSSGMQARLGFSVAAHLNPDVLLIDEVLAVGDMAFQTKCVRRMKEFRRQGLAIVFVSHNLQAVADLCPTTLYLHGEVRAHGQTQDAIKAYMHATHQDYDREGLTGEELVVLRSELLDDQGLPARVVKPGAPLTLRLSYVAREPIADLFLNFILYRSTDRLVVYHESAHSRQLGLDTLAAGERVTLEFVFRAHLTRGQYHLECNAVDAQTYRHLSRFYAAGTLTVDEARTAEGVANLEVEYGVVERRKRNVQPEDNRGDL